MKAASLCAGIGGLDLILESFGHEIAWHAEYDDAPSKVLAHHWPGVPNIGDITTADWADCEPVDIITAGYPCQPFSAAGLRKGTDDERHLWPFVQDAIAHLRPRYALLENVRGHLTLGFDTVLADLAALGFDAEWGVLGSSDVGGCHRRQRLWVLATDASHHRRSGRAQRDLVTSAGVTAPRRHDVDGRHVGDVRQAVDLPPTPTARDHKGNNITDTNLTAAINLLPTPRTSDTNGAGAHGAGGLDLRTAIADFGKYQAAVDRWAQIAGPPPAPTDAKGRLNPPFVEWMQGYPAGWVTGLGLTRTAQLKALGNAVQPQAGAAAYAALARRAERMEAAA